MTLFDQTLPSPELFRRDCHTRALEFREATVNVVVILARAAGVRQERVREHQNSHKLYPGVKPESLKCRFSETRQQKQCCGTALSYLLGLDQIRLKYQKIV